MRKDRILEDFKHLSELGLFLDPLLANSCLRGAHPRVASYVRGMVGEVYNEKVRLEDLARKLDNLPYSPRVMKFCFQDAIVSTAAQMAHSDTGRVVLNEELLAGAGLRLRQYIERHGLDRLYKLYFVVAGHDITQPFVYHKEISEAEFLEGIRHHPYSPSDLDVFFLVGLGEGLFRFKFSRSERRIQLTKRGANYYGWCRSLLVQSGFAAKRMALSYVYQFDKIEKWETVCESVWPDVPSVFQSYLQWLGITRRDCVLEVTSERTAPAIRANAFRTVNPNGTLTTIGSNAGMFERAIRRRFGADGFCTANFHRCMLEKLPSCDLSYDCIIGMFLQLQDPAQSVRQMARMVRPGGVVTVLQGLEFDLLRPFFREWFEPIFQLAQRRNVDYPQLSVTSSEDIVGWFKEANLVGVDLEHCWCTVLFDHPELVVQYLVRGVEFFQAELMELPWDDRRSVIYELIDRGRDVCRKYALGERTFQLETVMVKGLRPA